MTTALVQDPNAPWDLIRWVERQAPYWRVRMEGGSRPMVEIPRKGEDSSSGRMKPLEANYFDLQRAIGELGYRHPDGARLRLIVEMRMESMSFERISAQLPGRNSRWTVRKALEDAYYWICHPEGGRFLPLEAWV